MDLLHLGAFHALSSFAYEQVALFFEEFADLALVGNSRTLSCFTSLSACFSGVQVLLRPMLIHLINRFLSNSLLLKIMKAVRSQVSIKDLSVNPLLLLRHLRLVDLTPQLAVGVDVLNNLLPLANSRSLFASQGVTRGYFV